MCGRTACGLEPEQLCHACQRRTKENGGVSDAVWRDHPPLYQVRSTAFVANYNLCPMQFGPVLVSGDQPCLRQKTSEIEPCSSADRVVMPMMWGIVPGYCTNKTLADLKLKPINARIEGLLGGKSNGPFSNALNKKQRCVVVADGFYEWKGEKPKVPYLFYPKQNCSVKLWEPEGETVDDDGKWTGRQLLKMAGIFDCTLLAGEERSLFSYAVVTVASADWFKNTHERMPAILDTDEAVDRWLDINVSSADALRLLKPYQVELGSHQVDRKFVSDVRCHSNDCVRPSADVTPIKSPQDKKMKQKKFGTPPKKNLFAYFKRQPASDVNDNLPPMKIAKKEEED
uniref:Abasic site processing protein HMCES n=1 Tax=Plectus sambesii TaxID=2011161 RepID=A0A914W047_9BILA